MKVNLGDINYKIIMTNKLDKEISGDEPNRGICYYEELKILLDKDLPDDLKIQTLYHELSHAILEQTSFNSMIETELTEPMYEVLIDNLGKAIASLIHNNDIKKLESYVKKGSDND
jgi:Zn-dependent peptidase ImmA (M78 family)